MPPQRLKSGGELFTVDNADKDWQVYRYLHDHLQRDPAYERPQLQPVARDGRQDRAGGPFVSLAGPAVMGVGDEGPV